MCLIIIKENGNDKMSEKDLKRIYSDNPHGVGVLHYEKNKAIVNKYESFESFYSAYKDIKSGIIVTHFRYATSGEINKENIHPFPIRYKGIVFAYLFHNGIFTEYTYKGIPYSDTILFAKMCEFVLESYKPKDLKKAFELLDEIVYSINSDRCRVLVVPSDISVNNYYVHYGGFVKHLNYGLFSNLNFTVPKNVSIKKNKDSGLHKGLGGYYDTVF